MAERPGVLDRLALLSLARADTLPIPLEKIERPVVPQGTWDEAPDIEPVTQASTPPQPPTLFVTHEGETLRDRMKRADLPAEGLPVQHAGGLGVLPVVKQTHHHLHVSLGLHVAPHDAETKHRSAVPGDEARDDGVVGALARRYAVGMVRVQAKTRAPVL